MSLMTDNSLERSQSLTQMVSTNVLKMETVKFLLPSMFAVIRTFEREVSDL